MVARIFGCITKFFVVGMILHFFVHTLVSFGLAINYPRMDVLWLWKEILVVLGGVIAVFFVFQKKYFRQFLGDHFFLIYIFVLGLLILLSAFLSLVVHSQGLYDRVLAFKYDLFPFVVFGVFYVLVRFFGVNRSSFLSWFIRILKGLLVLSLVWYVLSHIAPEFLSVLGYSLDAYQWVYGEAPPLHYLTNIWTGSIRNQGLFGGPVSWGFFLIGFRPLFFAEVSGLRKNESIFVSRSKVERFWMLFWSLVYAANVFVSHSRAAWLVFALQCFVLLVIVFRRRWKKILFGGVVLGIVCIGGLVSRKRSDLFSRNLSDDGHVTHVLEGVEKFVSSPLVGLGAGTAGPASYRLGDDGFFNPENQYLQIGIEFGIFGLVLWFWLYTMLVRKGFENIDSESSSGGLPIRVFVVFGLLGLGVAGMFLHPAVDSQVMYVMMLLLALFL